MHLFDVRIRLKKITIGNGRRLRPNPKLCVNAMRPIPLRGEPRERHEMFRKLPMTECKSGYGNELPGLMIEGSPKKIVQPEGCQLEEVVEVVMGAAVEVVEVVGAEAKAMLEGAEAKAMPVVGVKAMPGVEAKAMPGVEAKAMSGAEVKAMPGVEAKAMVGVVGVVVLLKSLMSRSQQK